VREGREPGVLKLARAILDSFTGEELLLATYMALMLGAWLLDEEASG